MTKKTIGVIVGGIALVALVMGSVFWHQSWNKPVKQQASAPAPQLAEKQQSLARTTVSSHMLFVGEVFWGRGIEYYAKRSSLGYAFPFSGLTATDKQGFDAWIGDMECPITSSDIPYQTQVDSLQFNCRPEYTTEAAKWFDVLTLANNHTDNNGGAWGIDQTRNNLKAAKIQYFGDYNMHNTDNICDVIAMPAQIFSSNAGIQKTTLPMALCGFDYVGNVQPRQAEFDVMKQYAKVMPVIAMPHMGVEYRATAEDAKVAVYH